MPEFTPISDPYAVKPEDLNSKKDKKLADLEFKKANLQSLYDVDSPRFEGVTGGLGGTDKDGTIYDRTGQFSADRVEGIDSYEVFPNSPETQDYLFNNPRGIAKMEQQRAKLAKNRNVDFSTITNEDVFEEGAKGAVKELALLQAYSTGDEDYIQKVRDWTPSKELTQQWRTASPNLGSQENPLNIEVERAFSDSYGYYGRPLTQVRGVGSEYLLGEEGAGYTYDEPQSSRPAYVPTSTEDLNASIQKTQAERMSGGERLLNAVKGFGASFADSLLVSPLDAAGDLTGLYDIGKAEENTAAVNKFFGYNPYNAQEAMQNIGAQWDVVADENASVADRVRAAGNGIIEAFITPEMLGTSLGMLTSWITPGVVLKAVGVGSKFANTVKGIDKLVESGELTSKAAKLQKAKAFLSVPGAQAALANQSGFMVSALGAVNSQYEQFVENNNGVELEGADKAEWFAGRFAVQLVNQNLDKITDFSVIKSPGLFAGLVPAVKAMTQKEFTTFAKTIGKGVVGTAQNMGKEAAQEYSQTMMELFNARFGSKQFEDADSFADFITDERNTTEAGIAALAGAGGAPQFELVGVPGQLLGTAAGKLGKTIQEAGQQQAKGTPLRETVVTEEDLTPEQVQERKTTAENEADNTVVKFSNLLDDNEFSKVFAANTVEDQDLVTTPNLKAKLSENPAEYQNSINEIEKAEAVIQARVDEGRSKETDDVAFKILRKTKRELYNNLMEDERQPTLGSGVSAIDVVEDYLDTVDVKNGKLDLSEKEEQVLSNYVENNEIPPLRFKQLREFRTGEKDAETVRQESVGAGERSASTYRSKLRNLVNTPNPSRKAIAGVIDSIDNFLNTQENRKAAREAVENELRADLFNYNKQIEERKTIPAAVRSNLLKGRTIPNYGKAFVAVSEKADGKLEINESSLAVTASIQDTIDHLKRTKTRYGSQVNNIFGEDFVAKPQGISVRPNSSKQAARDLDQSFYDKRGVTKAIVDDKASSKQWAAGGDYSNDNQSLVNTGQYTADDIVVINSTAKSFDKKSKVRRELAKAYKAGATIVVDRETKDNKYLYKLLSTYNFKKVEEEGVTKYMPETKAASIRDSQAAKLKEKKTEESSLRKLINAFESGDQETADKIINERFNGNKENAKTFYENQVKNKSKEITDTLVKIATSKGYNSAELAEEMAKVINSSERGRLPKAAVDTAIKAVEDKVAELEQGETLLKNWNDSQKQAKRGKLDFNTWLKENVPNPTGMVKTLFDTAVGKNKKPVYVWYDSETKSFSPPTTNKNNVPEGAAYQVIELDPNVYAKVDKVTPLNSFNPKELRIAGKENIAFNQLVDTALKNLEVTLRSPNLKYQNTDNSILDLTNSPASSLIYSLNEKNELVPNETTAIALQLSLYNFVKNSAYLLKKGKKSKKDLSEILGVDESQISREAVQMMSDKGLLYKTASNSIGRNVAGMLGISRKSDSEADAQAYDALIADLGQTALLMAVKTKDNPNGFLELDNSLLATKFATTVLGKDSNVVDDGNNAKVLFIQAIKDSDEILDNVSSEAKVIEQAIPDIDIDRKEPFFSKISDKVKKKALKKIRNERLGIKIAEPSQKAIEELMDTEWSADLSLIREMIDNSDLIKERLGYIAIPSDAYEKLSFEEKEVQESINRNLDKSFEEMQWLSDSNENQESVSMWFQYFFSKNGRFFIDSNTINPQNDKHLHRFTVQPKSHINTFKVVKGKFTVGGKDVTSKVHYALSQAFGFATDKQDTAKIKQNAESILNSLTTVEAITKAKKEFLETGEVKNLNIEIEHLGHALQGFKFLESMVSAKGKEFDSAITAEFDAVTSGFGLKSLQMPIINNIEEWLKKVGVLLDSDSVNSNVEAVSMNDILDSGNVRDSYQTLAGDVKTLSFEEMEAELEKFSVVKDNPYNRNLWEALSEFLPQVNDDGSISSALRSLFKYPFMTFNYSASIKNIRKNLLTGELLTTVAKEMAKADLTKTDDSVVKLMQAFVTDKGDINKLQNDIRTKPLRSITSKPGVKTSLEQYLGQMIEASYGAQVEKILIEQFKPFVEAQDNVNAAFKGMFEVFSIALQKKLLEARKKGPVSVDKEKEIYTELKSQWPMIKGPLSTLEEEFESGDGIGIYGIQTSSPYGVYAGRKPSRSNISKSLSDKLGGQKDVRVSQMIKQLTAAVAAGSVVPIHYIDGAIMAQTINSLAEKGIKGITSIHDAIMPSLLQMEEAQQAYNEQTLKVNTSYSFINEIMTSLDRFLEEIPLQDSDYKKRTVKVDKQDIPLKDFLLKTRNEFAELTNRVNLARENTFAILNKGAKIMHMAGTAEGVYNVEAGSIEYKSVEKVMPKGYNENNTIDGVALPELDAMAQNICK